MIAILLALGAGATVVATSRPILALGAPALALGALIAARRPTLAVLGIFLATSIPGTMTAYTPLPGAATAEVLLACTWAGVVGALALGRRPVPLWLWPGLIAPVLYLALSVFSILLADSIGNALAAFRLSIYYISAFVLVAIAPWPTVTLRRIARGFVAITVVVGSYCALRYVIGPGGNEEALARLSAVRLPFSASLRFYGSFLNAQQLAAWGAALIPFLLAVTLGWRGPWRLLAVGGLGLCAFAVFATEVRVGAIAAVAGATTVVGLYTFARGFPTARIANALAAVFVTLSLGYAGYSLSVGQDRDAADRFGDIFDRDNDRAWIVRQYNWAAAWELIEENPLGVGLGTTGTVGQERNEGGPAGLIYSLDNSFLKIGIEQGIAVMAYFIFAFLVLLATLAWKAISITDRERATMGLAACGTLASLLVLFYAGIYIESIAALTGWLIVGLGVAHFTRPDEPERPDDDRAAERNGGGDPGLAHGPALTRRPVGTASGAGLAH